MKKLLNNPWFVAALALVAIGFVAWSLRDQMSDGASRTGPSAAVEDDVEFMEDDGTGGTVAEGGVLSIPAMLAALVLPTNLPDPFVRRAATMVAGDPMVETGPVVPDHTESIRLTAVWNQGKNAFAVMNGRIMRPGDVTGRLTVDTIATDGVWVSHWKGRDFVSFGGEFTLVTPASGPVVRSLFPDEN